MSKEAVPAVIAHVHRNRRLPTYRHRKAIRVKDRRQTERYRLRVEGSCQPIFCLRHCIGQFG